MSSKISELSLLSVVGNDDYVVLARTSDSTNYKFKANSLFTSLVEIGHSTPVYLIDGISSTNALSQRGLKSNSSILTLAVDTLGSDKNVLFDIDESAIDLSLCDNSTSAFLTSTDLTSVTGVLAVADGGTGTTTFKDKAVLITQDSGDPSLTSTQMVNSGELIIGGASGPAIATLTAGSNISITNGDGSISIASSFSTATSLVDMAGFNIDMDSGWISDDGTDGGIKFGSDKIYVGTAANEFSYGSVSLAVDNGIVLDGGKTHSIFVNGDLTGGILNVSAGDSTGGGNDGGNLYLKGGDADTSGDAGSIFLVPGVTGTGAGGKVVIRNTIGAGVYDAVTIESNDVTVEAGNLKVTKTGKGLELPVSTASQNSALTENVTINEVSGYVTLARQSIAAESQAEFTISNSTVSANSLVFVSLISPGSSSESVNAIVVAQVSSITNGSFNVTLTNMSSSTATDTQVRQLQFFVLN
jgi:hypothetical protein